MKKLYLILFLALFIIPMAMAQTWTASLNDSLTAYWDFEETGGDWIDKYNYNDNLTNNGIGYNASGIIESAGYLISQENDYADAAHSTDLADSSISVSAWGLMNTTSPSWGTIVNKEQQDLANAYALQIKSDGSVRCLSTTETAQNVKGEAGVGTVAQGEWIHYVGVFDIEAGVCRVYINGTLVVTSAVNTSEYTLANTGTFRVGSAVGFAQGFNGTLDEIGIWKRALNQTDVTQLYNNGDGISFTPPPPAPNNPPTFTTIPANQTIAYPNGFNAQFEATDADNDTITWSVNESTHFKINQSGYLENNTLIGGGIYEVAVGIDDGNGGTDSATFKLTVTPVPTVCTLTTNSPVTEGTNTLVTLSCTSPEGTLGLFRDGVDVTAENGVGVLLEPGTYSYIGNVTASQNYTENQTTATVEVAARTGVQAVCQDSDATWADGAALAGLIMVIALVGLVLATLVLSVTGIIDLGNLGDVITLEKAPTIIVIVGLTFLVLATMSFLIANNVCVAFGA